MWGRPRHSHFCLLTLSVMPAVPGLWHQQRDQVTFLEAQEGAVISGSVRENGLHPRPAVPLEPCGHGAGARQRLVFGWWETETKECPTSFTRGQTQAQVPNLAHVTPGANKTSGLTRTFPTQEPGSGHRSRHRPPATAKGAATLRETPQDPPPGNAVCWWKPMADPSSTGFPPLRPEAGAALAAKGMLPVPVPPPAPPKTSLTVAVTSPTAPQGPPGAEDGASPDA